MTIGIVLAVAIGVPCLIAYFVIKPAELLKASPMAQVQPGVNTDAPTPHHVQPNASTDVPSQPKPPWYKATWLIALLLVFVAPVGAVLMWLWARWPVWVKVLGTVWAVVILAGVLGGRSDESRLVALSTPSAVAAARPTGAPAAKLAPTAVPKPAAQPTAKTAPNGKVGERVESAGVALTVNSVERQAQLGQFFKAAAGKTYLLIDVTIETTGREKAPYNPFYFKLKDSDGYEYTVGIGADRSLQSGELAAGERARGGVSFEIPENAAGLVVTYQPLVIFGGYQPIKIELD